MPPGTCPCQLSVLPLSGTSCGRLTSAELLAALAVCSLSVSWSNRKQASLLPLTQHYLCSVHKHNRLETT